LIIFAITFNVDAIFGLLAPSYSTYSTGTLKYLIDLESSTIFLLFFKANLLNFCKRIHVNSFFLILA